VQVRRALAALSDQGGSPARLRRRRDVALSAAIGIAVVALDQVTKTWAVNRLRDGRTIHVVWTLQFDLVLNQGVAFGLGKGNTGIIALIGVVVLILLATLGRAGITNRLQAVAVGLVLGGAAGNMIDRLFRHHHGAVIDFIDLQWWPVFNVADSAITCGAVLLVVSGLLHSGHHRHDRPDGH
jgi:signal peptidase II